MPILRGMVISVVGLFMAAPYANSEPRDPIGEFGDYEIETNSSRTTSLIRSGTLYTEVEELILGSDGEEDSYRTRIDYSFLIQFLGRREGVKFIDIPASYFTEEFMNELRTSGHYESDKFKVEHLGYADTTTMDGTEYPNCDLIRIYDIQDVRSLDLLTALLAPKQFGEEIENMEIIAHIFVGMPVLGAVKIDVSGDYQGQSVKAGGDYFQP